MGDHGNPHHSAHASGHGSVCAVTLGLSEAEKKNNALRQPLHTLAIIDQSKRSLDEMDGRRCVPWYTES